MLFVLICMEVYARWFGFTTQRRVIRQHVTAGDTVLVKKDKLSLGVHHKRINTMRHWKIRQWQERNLISLCSIFLSTPPKSARPREGKDNLQLELVELCMNHVLHLELQQSVGKSVDRKLISSNYCHNWVIVLSQFSSKNTKQSWV